MAYYITDDCISCGACAAECPVEAISQGDSIYEIDESLCIDCGAYAEVVPGRFHHTTTAPRFSRGGCFLNG